MKNSFPFVFITAAFVTFSSAAENIAKNGSFEESADLNPDPFTQKGFVVTRQWAKNWTINNCTKPCEIALVEATDAPDGKKFLRVKSTGASHIYMADSISGDTVTKVTFSAKGEALDGKGPSIKVHAYLYKGGIWYGKNYTAANLKLENEWKLFTIDIPAQPENIKFNVAFEFEGICDLDNVKLEK